MVLVSNPSTRSSTCAVTARKPLRKTDMDFDNEYRLAVDDEDYLGNEDFWDEEEELENLEEDIEDDNEAN